MPITLDQLDRSELERFVKKLMGNPGGDIPLGGVQGLPSFVAAQQAEARMLWGIFDDSGKLAGTGFTVSFLGTGNNEVTFDSPFPIPPVTVLTPVVAGGGAAALIPTPTETVFRVEALDGGGSPADLAVMFMTREIK